VATLLTNYQAPALRVDERTRLLSTTVLMKDTLVVRIMEIEGELAAVARHLATDPAIQRVERELNQYLAERVDHSDPQARRAFLQKRLMRTLGHYQTHPLIDDSTAGQERLAAHTSRYAVLYQVKQDKPELAERMLRSGCAHLLDQASTVIGEISLFARDDVFIQLIATSADANALVSLLCNTVQAEEVATHVDHVFIGDNDFASRDGRRRFFEDRLMTVLTDRRTGRSVA
jgi:hypothetical protein